MGVWRKYAPQLESTMIAEMRTQHMPRLRALNALHYPASTNWAFDPHYDYNITVSAGKQEESSKQADVVADEADTAGSKHTDTANKRATSSSGLQVTGNDAGISKHNFADPHNAAVATNTIFKQSSDAQTNKPQQANTQPATAHPMSHSKQSIEHLLDNINARATRLATPYVHTHSSSSPAMSAYTHHRHTEKHYTITEVQRVLRNKALNSLHGTYNFAKQTQQTYSPATIRTYMSQLKYQNADVRITEIVCVGYVFVGSQRFQAAIEVFEQLLDILFFEPSFEFLSENNRTGNVQSSSVQSIINQTVVLMTRDYKQQPHTSNSGAGKKSKKSKQAKQQQPEAATHIYTQEGVLVDDRDSAIGCLLGLGTAYAYTHRTADAVCVFTDALKLNPADTDILKRRSEVFTATGAHSQALEDLDNILVLADTKALSTHSAHTQSGYADDDESEDMPLRSSAYVCAPNNEVCVSAHYDKGKIFVMGGRFKDAYNELHEVGRALNLTLNVSDQPDESHHALVRLPAHAHTHAQTMIPSFNTAQYYFLMGKCFMKFGETVNALTYFNASLMTAGTQTGTAAQQTQTQTGGAGAAPLKETHVEAAFTHMEAGHNAPALSHIAAALRIDPKFKLAYGYRGLFYQNMGKHTSCVQDFMSALRLEQTDTQCLLLGAVCFHALGEFNHSYTLFQRLMTATAHTHVAWFRMESMLFTALYAHTPLTAYHPDKDMNVRVRDGLTLGDPNLISTNPSVYRSYAAQLTLTYNKLPNAPTNTQTQIELLKHLSLTVPTVTPQQQTLMDATKHISQWIQLNSPGFIANKRIHTSFGLSVLQAAQALAKHVYLLSISHKHGSHGSHDATMGLLVPNSAVSKLNYFGAHVCAHDGSESAAGCPPGYHVFGWRDFFDIIIRWRQVQLPHEAP
jgi:tetratricopeptide (TPR) repeat protein